LLARAPDAGFLAEIGDFLGDETAFGQALARLARAARESDAGEVSAEYDALFIGVGRGELVPYASYYLTGFLNERPLAHVRDDMMRLGITRSDETSDPEDHIGSLCEMMAGLIAGSFGKPAPLAEQQRFFDRHLGRWAARFFKDLEAAPSVSFYKPVGEIGRLFMAIEAEGFKLAA
jgi:TorA maturation chaperone TorD